VWDLRSLCSYFDITAFWDVMLYHIPEDYTHYNHNIAT
jgi:hypothetical protein